LLSPALRSVVAIDEPEAGLHPKLLPIVGDMIKAASGRAQVIVTTHSPDLLNRFSVEDIAVMRREESRAIWERPGNRKALVRMLESTLGGTVGDLLRSGELEGIAK
jgi:predicted ATPase